MRSGPPTPAPVDPFDLPDWLGERQVTWVAEGGVRDGARVPGRLQEDAVAGGGAPAVAPGPPEPLACDLLAVDAAFPVPVVDEATRTAAHQAWHHGQVHLGALGGRLTLLTPGAALSADTALEAVARLARAVGSDGHRYAVLLRIGAPGRRRGSESG